MDSKHLVNKVLVHYENWKKNEAEEDGFKMLYEFNELAKTHDLEAVLEVHNQIKTVITVCVQQIDMVKFRLWHAEQDKKRRNDT